MWGRKRVHRGPTMIALRARREATEIAHDVAHPHLELPPPPEPVLRDPWRNDEIDYAPAQPFYFFEDEIPEPAPAWFKWVFFASLTISITVGILLIKYLG